MCWCACCPARRHPDDPRSSARRRARVRSTHPRTPHMEDGRSKSRLEFAATFEKTGQHPAALFGNSTRGCASTPTSRRRAYLEVTIVVRSAERRREQGHRRTPSGSTSPRFSVARATTTDANRYVARGTLNLKGVRRRFEVPFTVTDAGDVAQLDGEFTVKRGAFGIGGSGTATNVIRADVRLKFNVRAAQGWLTDPSGSAWSQCSPRCWRVARRRSPPQAAGHLPTLPTLLPTSGCSAQERPPFPRRPGPLARGHRSATQRLGHARVVAGHDVTGYVAPDAGRADLYVHFDTLVVDEPALRAAAGIQHPAHPPPTEERAATCWNACWKPLAFARVVVTGAMAGNKQPVRAVVTLHGTTGESAPDNGADKVPPTKLLPSDPWRSTVAVWDRAVLDPGRRDRGKGPGGHRFPDPCPAHAFADEGRPELRRAEGPAESRSTATKTSFRQAKTSRAGVVQVDSPGGPAMSAMVRFAPPLPAAARPRRMGPNGGVDRQGRIPQKRGQCAPSPEPRVTWFGDVGDSGGRWSAAVDLGAIPHLSEARRQHRFGGFKNEDLNKSARVRPPTARSRL